jgi:hypothetical protein
VEIQLTLGLTLAIIDEWERTVGQEYVQAFVTKLESMGVLFSVPALGRIPPAVSRKLVQLGFLDTIDKVLLRVAMVLADKIVVSGDADFWDPGKKDIRRLSRNPHAPVAALCRNALGVTALTLSQAQS